MGALVVRFAMSVVWVITFIRNMAPNVGRHVAASHKSKSADVVNPNTPTSHQFYLARLVLIIELMYHA